MTTIKQITKDCITLGIIIDFLSNTDLKAQDYIEGYSGELVHKVVEPLIKDNEKFQEILLEIANDCYKRIQKKFPKQ